MILRLLNSRYFLWALLAFPGVFMSVRYSLGHTFYGEFMHSTGEYSIRLLMIVMAMTPLRLLFPRRSWTGWLLQRRRYFGIAAFGYAALHTLVYVVRLRRPEEIIADASQLGILAGWLGFAVFIPLALTSNDYLLRRLGPWWRRVHGAVYLAAALSFAHWILVAFDAVPALAHLGVLAALESYRIWKMARKTAAPSSTPFT